MGLFVVSAKMGPVPVERHSLVKSTAIRVFRSCVPLRPCLASPRTTLSNYFEWEATARPLWPRRPPLDCVHELLMPLNKPGPIHVWIYERDRVRNSTLSPRSYRVREWEGVQALSLFLILPRLNSRAYGVAAGPPTRRPTADADAAPQRPTPTRHPNG